jgi:two-component system chemotaxis response regulator CheY
MERTLLVTDDSLIIRELIKDTAVQHGWRVIGEASDGQSAIDRYRELRPTAVTLDLVMPQYDGLHALKGIRAFDGDARVLVVSAIDQTNVLREAIQCGASDFIVKPFAKDRVAAALDALVPTAT